MPSPATGSKRGRDTDASVDEDGAFFKRAKPEPGRSASPRAYRSDDTFWYHDGNVIVRIPGEGTLFKLHSSRLARQCGYFKDAFESPDVRVTEWFQRYPVYNAPHELTTKAFKDLLTAIENPLEDLEFLPSQSHTVSLLESADILDCNAVIRLAENRLRKLWDSRDVPMKRGPDDIRSYKAAISTIQLAREYKIDGILKRAFYELLSSGEYWEAYRADRASIELSHKDKERLTYARAVLGELWGEFILAVPDTDVSANVVRRLSDEWCCYNYSDRGPNWRSTIVEKGDLKSGATDPLRYNVVDKRRAYLKEEGWCKGCLANKESAWQVKRAEWWGLLDELFDL